MNIGQRLTLGFCWIALLIGISGYVAVDASRKALQESIGKTSLLLASQILSNVDRAIHYRIEQLQIASKDVARDTQLGDSNRAFAALENAHAYITQRDAEWTSVPQEAVTPAMRDLIDNPLSEYLRTSLASSDFYRTEYGYELFPEIFVTNKYGANVAQTQKTSDYYQADEEWWQVAKDKGLYVGDVEYDKSAGVYSTDLGISIRDASGNFLGVMKVICNIDEPISVIKEFAQAARGAGGTRKGYATRDFKLLTSEGKIIHASEPGFEFLEAAPPQLLERLLGHGSVDQAHYFVSGGDIENEGEKLFACARSRGYRMFEGLGWILVVEYDTETLFAPVFKLRNFLLLIVLTVMLVGILAGTLMAQSISRPISKLVRATAELGKGKFGTRVDTGSRDELGVLATSFNTLSGRLADLVLKEKQLSAQAAQAAVERKRAVELQKAYEDLRKTRDMLIQAEKLNAVGQMASGVAHEVRNPLAAITQGIGYLEKEPSAHTKETSEVLGIMRDSIRRANDIIGLLLDFSKATKLKLQAEEINSVLESALELVKTRVEFSKIEVAWEKKTDLPRVLIDRNRVEQVLVNAFLNSAQAMAEGGRIAIRSRVERLSRTKPGVGVGKKGIFSVGEEAVIVEIEDTGGGISEENLKKVFDPFFTTKSPRGGVGLGLSVSRNIIDMHKCLLEVVSQEGQGTKLILTLRIASGVLGQSTKR